MLNPRLIGGFIALTGLVSGQTAMGQPVPTKLPDSVHLFPAGAQRGTTVGVHIGVEQTPPRAQFFIRGAGVSGDSFLNREIFDPGQPSPRRPPTEIPIHYPRQWAGEITVAADAQVGIANWDLFCASGGSSGSLPFVIGKLPEFLETESNSTPATAQPVEIPVTLNGQIHGERDLDYYRFSLRSGQVVYAEVLARRLGSRLEPTISILDKDGRAVAFQEDSLGDDPLIAFKAPADGTYFLSIGNVSVHGSPAHVYRVNLTNRPVAPYVFPIGAPAGRATKFFLTAMSGDGGVRLIERELILPADTSDVFVYHDDELANDVPLRVLPADSPVTRNRPRTPDGNPKRERGPEISRVQTPRLRVGLPAASRANKYNGQELPIAIGEVANGQLTSTGSDVYTLEIDKPQPLDIRVVAPDAVSAAGLVLMNITDPNSKTVGRNSPSPTSDAVKAYQYLGNPVVGQHTITLHNIGSTSSKHRVSGYQIEVLPARLDFRLTAGSDCLSVTQGSSLEIPIKAIRLGGFDGEIQIRTHGLPKDISVENAVIAKGKNDLKLKLTVSEGQPSTRHEIRLAGIATIADAEVTRPIQVQHRGHDSFGRGAHGTWRDVIALTVRHKPVFRLYCEEAYQYAHRGTIYPYRMTLERLDGFAERVFVQRGDRQNRDLDGIEFVQTAIGTERSEFMMPIYLPETMHINIQGQSQLYTQAYASFTDSNGQRQSVLAVAEKRNMLRTMPTVVKLSTRTESLTGQPGEVVVAGFELERTSNMRNPMRLELVKSDSKRITIEQTPISRGQVRVDVPITIPDGHKRGEYQLTFQASGALDAKRDQTAITSATVKLRVEAKRSSSSTSAD